MKYRVIGGQYQVVYYGETDNLHAAKCLATKNLEYWDNWQGWHYPRIYITETLEEPWGGVYLERRFDHHTRTPWYTPPMFRDYIEQELLPHGYSELKGLVQ